VERNPEDVKHKSFYTISFYFGRVEILKRKGKEEKNTTIFKYNDKLVLIANFTGEPEGDRFSPEFQIYNELGQLVSIAVSGAYHGKYFNKKVKKVRIEIGLLFLTSRDYELH